MTKSDQNLNHSSQTLLLTEQITDTCRVWTMSILTWVRERTWMSLKLSSIFMVTYRLCDLSSIPAVRIYFQMKSLYTRESVWPLHSQIKSKTLIFVPSGRNCSDLLQLGCCYSKHPIMHFFPLLNYTGRRRAARVGSWRVSRYTPSFRSRLTIDS